MGAGYNASQERANPETVNGVAVKRSTVQLRDWTPTICLQKIGFSTGKLRAIDSAGFSMYD